VSDSTRREFVCGAARLLAGSAVAAAVVPLAAACDKPDPTRAWTFRASPDVSSLTADGQAVISKTAGVDGAPILIIRTARDSFTALSTRCAHEGCPVNAPVKGIITCPCHGSQYALDGKVLRGPTIYPLTRYLTYYDRNAGRLSVGVTE
jgi:cytochrome b6-f complex iron-sulfur subunit